MRQPGGTLTVDKLLALAESLPRPKVRRVLVTRVVPDEEEGLLLEDKGWLLVGRRTWEKVRAEVPKANDPTIRIMGLPVEEVRPGSKRERQILERLGIAIRKGLRRRPTDEETDDWGPTEDPAP